MGDQGENPGVSAMEQVSDGEFGGEAPCYAPDVCEVCGLLISDRLADVCPRCGTPRDPQQRGR